MKKQNQILAVGTGSNGKTVSFSDADAIEVWQASAANLAGSLPIEELDTRIRAAERLGAYVSVYAEDQLALVRYVGLPYVYGAQVVLDGIGAVGKAAVCSDGRMNYGVGRNGIWQTDGQSYRYIDEGFLRDYLQENVNWDQRSKIVASRNDLTNCFDFFFPMLGSNVVSEGWSFDPRQGGWSQVPAYEFAVGRVLLDKPIIGDSTGNVQLCGANEEAAGALNLTTKPLLVQGPGGPLRTTATIDEVELMLKAARAAQFRYCVSERPDGDWTDSSWHNIQAGHVVYELEAMPSGTFHKLEFRSTADLWELDLQGLALYGEADGVRRGQL